MRSVTSHQQSVSLIGWLLFLGVGYLLVLPYDSIVLTYLFRIPALTIISLIIIQRFSSTKPKYLLPITIIIAVCIFNILRMTDDVFNFDIFLSIYSLFSLLLLIIISPTIRRTNKLRNIIAFWSIIAIVILTIHSIAPYSHLARNHHGQYFESPYMTFGYGNSNFAGIIALLIYCCIWSSASYKKLRSKIYISLIIGWTLFLIFQTNCRSAFAAALCIPVASFLFSKYKLPKWLLIITCLIPFLFVPFYMDFANDPAANTEVMGKNVLSGRQIIYQAHLDKLKYLEDYILGSFDNHPFNNAHNGPLSIFVSLGIVGTTAFFFIIINRLILDNKHVNTFQGKCAIYSILTIFIESCGEAHLFLGGFPSIIFIFIIFIIASDNGDVCTTKSRMD